MLQFYVNSNKEYENINNLIRNNGEDCLNLIMAPDYTLLSPLTTHEYVNVSTAKSDMLEEEEKNTARAVQNSF